MSVIQIDVARGNTQALIALAQLFDRLEHSGTAPDPAQYQTVVARLQRALTDPVPQNVLDAVLARHSGTAELYENMHYEQAGLSRAALDLSVSSEMLAGQALARIARQAGTPPPSDPKPTPL
jgi:hypothetical protein